jgi:hypothetical protein
VTELTLAALAVAFGAALAAAAAMRGQRRAEAKYWTVLARAEYAEAAARTARKQAIAAAMDAVRAGYLGWCGTAYNLPAADIPGHIADQLRDALTTPQGGEPQ